MRRSVAFVLAVGWLAVLASSAAPGTARAQARCFENSDDNATLRRAKLAVLSEPYPQATAGTPEHYRFDPGSDTFTYSYVPDRSIHVPTVIYVPAVHYPSGYTVAVSGARVVSAPGARLLELSSDPGASDVEVTVS